LPQSPDGHTGMAVWLISCKNKNMPESANSGQIETKKVRCFSCYHTAIMARMQYKTAVSRLLSLKMLF